MKTSSGLRKPSCHKLRGDAWPLRYGCPCGTQVTRVARQPAGRFAGARTRNGASFRAVASTGFQSTSLTGWSSGILVKIIVITTSGIKITASERIMSPACRRSRRTRHVLIFTDDAREQMLRSAIGSTRDPRGASTERAEQ